MTNTTIEYPGYSIEIPEALLQSFKLLSTFLRGVEDGQNIDLSSPSRVTAIVKDCHYAVIAAIGKAFAHDAQVMDALAQWRSLSEIQQTEAVFQAAANTEPVDIIP